MPEEHSTAYKAIRERVTGLVRDAAPAMLDAPSPATPGWSVRDVLAHLVGVTNDIVNGRMEGIATDAWTQAQVDPRHDTSVDALLAEWGEFGPQFEAMLAAAPAEISGQALLDGASHEQDLRHALGAPGARDSDAVAIGWTWMAGLRTRGNLPAICFITENDTATFGAGEPIVTVEASCFELMRASTGRRTAHEIELYGWQPEARPAILITAPFFTMRTSSLGE
jgi:uncharacterized protein (TIGR03083 family)